MAKIKAGTRVHVLDTEIYGTVTKVDDEVVTFESEHDGAPFERPLDQLEVAPVTKDDKAAD